MKRGFTLIEIIVVVILVTIIGVGSTVTVVKLNKKDEKNVLIKNEENFTKALEVYLSKHNEVANNVNNEAHGAVISLEVLKNEGLIKDNLDIDYKNNYYIVSTALLSNIEPSDLDGQCKNSVSLNIIANWQNKNNSSEVLYFCPKSSTPKDDADEPTPDLEELACKDITYNKDTIAYDIICKAKKNSLVLDNINESINGIVTTMNNMSIIQNENINDAYNQLKDTIDSYYNNHTIYDEDAQKTIKRVDSSPHTILSAYLSKAEDDGGYSYYYRDKPNDNYVNFAGMCWRIYRIDGNGNIKLILRDKNKECPNSSSTNRSLGIGNYGYKKEDGLYIASFLEPVLSPEKSMAVMYKDFQTTLNDKIKSTYGNTKDLSTFLLNDWCIDNRLDGNPSYDEAKEKRNNNIKVPSLKAKNNYSPTFKCEVEKTNKFADGTPMYVAAVTYDEVKIGTNIFAESGGDLFWTLNIASNDYCGLGYSYQCHQDAYIAGAYYSAFTQNYWVETSTEYIQNQKRIKAIPVIQLKAGIQIESGTGLLNDPYIIKIN